MNFTRTLKGITQKPLKNLYIKNGKSKDKEKSYVLKADIKTLVRMITAYNFGQKVDLSEILRSEMMPVPLA